MLAFTINIPDWIFNAPFWSGFGVGIGLTAIIFVIASSYISPWR